MADSPKSVPTENKSSSKKGLIIFGVIGCLWIAAIFILGAIAVGFWIYSESQKEDYNYNYNTNYDDYNYNYNWNINEELTPDENGQLFDSDGVSHGFEIDSTNSSDLYAYQVGAFADMDGPNTEWPSFRFTLDLPDDVAPMTDEADTGSLWVGTSLDNGYFIQVGAMSTNYADENGNMDWNYFWEVWDDQDNYLYGLQDDLSLYETENDPSFTLTCQDPATGDWEFWVNDEIVGKANTGDCSTTLRNAYVFWEMTTDKTSKEALPGFGPYTFKNFEYWDGYDWQPVEKTYVSYSYGSVAEGTQRDQDNVCQPYGAEAVAGERAARFGSGLGCMPMDTVIWE